MKVVYSIIIVLCLIFAMSLLGPELCNPKGSIAAQINWAGHKVCK